MYIYFDISKYNSPWLHISTEFIVPFEILMKFRYMIVKLILLIDVWDISCEFAIRWLSLNFIDDKSTFVRVMACSSQANKPFSEPVLIRISDATWHDDVIKWKHFPCYWPFCVGNSLVTGEFPTQRPVTRSFDVFFDLRLNKRFSKQ